MKEQIKSLVEKLEQKKLKNIEAFDLTEKSELIKLLILATASNEKNARTIAYEIVEDLQAMGKVVEIDGEFPGDWIILDAEDLVLEIFTEDTRTYYNLEKLWGDSKNRMEEVTNKKRRNKATNNKNAEKDSKEVKTKKTNFN